MPSPQLPPPAHGVMQQLLRADTTQPAACCPLPASRELHAATADKSAPASTPDSPPVSSPASPTSIDTVSVWSRLLQHFSSPAPVANRFLPKMKAGPLLLEVGQKPEWKSFEVVLAGTSAADLALYYYADKDDSTPQGCIRLQGAHMDTLDEVLMVVTKDKTWFLCADNVYAAAKWFDAVCAAIDSVSDTALGQLDDRPSRCRQLSSSTTGVTLPELQARSPQTRVDEFLEVFVRSNREDMCLQAAKGALAWSCMRSLTWKVWLSYLPDDVPFDQWIPIARKKRQSYEVARRKHSVFRDVLTGKQTSEVFLTACETSEDTLLYDIYKDVRRTRGEMSYFRDPSVQCLLIRVLYTYSEMHPEVSYNQGMSELLATIVYLLHIEQWPIDDDDDDLEEVIPESEAAIGRLSGSYFFPSAASPSKRTTDDDDDASYVYVESFINIQADDSFLDRDTFLRLTPFSGGSGKYYECCRDAAEEIVRQLTAAEFVEHDAYLLLEEVMLRMAGAYCPQAPRRRSVKPKEKPLGSADQLPASPLDDQMNGIHHHILSRCDPPTARHLVRLGVEPQVFLLRWVRVLMAREFEMTQVWQIWDAIFSLTPSDFSFINLLCVAVVRDFREEILVAEDATSVLLELRGVSERMDPARLVANARELYDALLVAAAVEASMASV